MYKMLRIDKRALRVILNALNEKTNRHFDVDEVEFISASNTRYGFAVLFRSHRYLADIVVSVFTDREDDLRYIDALLFYYENFEDCPIDATSIKMTYTKLCSLMEEQI